MKKNINKVLLIVALTTLNIKAFASSNMELNCTSRTENSKFSKMDVSAYPSESPNSTYIQFIRSYCFTAATTINSNDFSKLESHQDNLNLTNVNFKCDTTDPMSAGAKLNIDISSDLSVIKLSSTSDATQSEVYDCTEKSEIKKGFDDLVRKFLPDFGS